MSERVVNLRDFRDPEHPRRFLLPPDMVRIDRITRWGNPFRISRWRDISPTAVLREEAIMRYRLYAGARLARQPDWLEPLRGKRFACWCSPLLCHGDVLAELIP